MVTPPQTNFVAKAGEIRSRRVGAIAATQDCYPHMCSGALTKEFAGDMGSNSQGEGACAGNGPKRTRQRLSTEQCIGQVEDGSGE